MHPACRCASSVRIALHAAPSRSRSWLISRIGLARRGDPRLELELGGDVEEVVGLVEQQHLRLAREQHVEHEPLALAARELRRRARADLVERRADDPAAARRPTGPRARSRRARTSRRSPRRAACPRRPGRRRAASSRSAASIRSPASRSRAGAGSSSSSRTVRPPSGADADVLRHVGERRRCRRRPRSAGSCPARTRNSVDLPTPLAPTSPTCCPGETLNETSENSRSPPGWAYARLETTTCDTAQPRSAPTASATDSNPSRSSSAGRPRRISRTTPGPR